MYFEVYGPFALPRADRAVDTTRLAEFWAEVDAQEDGLASAIGAYLFTIRNGESARPHYVGMTCNRSGFRAECFQAHKLDHYNEVMADANGTPELHLVALLTGSGRFSRAFATSQNEICFVERSLIGMALRRNADLRNVRDTRYLRDCSVRGIMGTGVRGRHPNSARTLRKALGVA